MYRGRRTSFQHQVDAQLLFGTTLLVTIILMIPFTIAAHTSMIQKKDIMITVHKETHFDMFRNSEWPLFNEQVALRTLGQVPKLSLVEFKVFKPGLPRDMDELDSACTSRVSEYIFDKDHVMGKFKAWLFLAHSSWRTDSAISRSEGLDSLPADWHLAQLPRSQEVLFESDEGVQFAGLAEVNAESFQTATRILRKHGASCIILSDRPDIDSAASIKAIYRAAFPPEDKGITSSVNWGSLSLALCLLGDVLVRVSGSYDERLASIDCIMLPEKTVFFE
ncbi:MAG: hypothetical protein JWR26_1028 [Pedosphaera sp.]|nr:hypothetical protein [Pedosphaera sp.]